MTVYELIQLLEDAVSKGNANATVLIEDEDGFGHDIKETIDTFDGNLWLSPKD